MDGGGCSRQQGRVGAGAKERLANGWYPCSMVSPSSTRVQSLVEQLRGRRERERKSCI